MSQQWERMMGMLSYMGNKPTLDEVAQYLVLDVFREYNPRTALISVFDSSGNVSAAGSFGLAADVVRALRRMSLWDRAPSIDSIRSGEPLRFNDRQSLLHQYPWLEAHESLLNPTLVWPLTLGTQRLGSVQMQFAEPVVNELAASDFGAAAPILGLYVSLVSAANHPVDSSDGHHPVRTVGVEKELSSRQVRILHLLAEGLTNPQIAARIGFSDSTVRQETMAIYRFLGADGRREAVHIAGLRGLLNEETTPKPMPIMDGHSQHPLVWRSADELSMG